jgi:hypothetical protein
MTPEDDVRATKPCPLDTSSVFSRLTFSWVAPLIRDGSARPLQGEDMFGLQGQDTAASLVARLEAAWEAQLQQRPTRPSLPRAILSAWGGDFAKIVLYTAFEDSTRIVQPLLLLLLVRDLRNYDVGGDAVPPAWRAYVYAVLLALFGVLQVFLHHILFFRSMRAGWQLRSATIGLINRKVLRLKGSALADTSTGQIVNLVSNDVWRFDLACTFGAFLIVAPLEAS